MEQPESVNVSIDNEERLSTSELALIQSMAFNQQVSHQTSKSTSCSNEVTNVNKRQNIAISKQKESEIEVILEKNIQKAANNTEKEDMMKDTLPKHCRRYPEIKEENERKLSTCPVCHHNFSFAIAFMFHLARSPDCALVFDKNYP